MPCNSDFQICYPKEIVRYFLLHICYQLIFWYQRLHDDPSQEIGDGTEDEDDEIPRFNSFITQELQVGVGCVVEQYSATLVNKEGTHTSSYASDTGDGPHRMFWEYVTHCGRVRIQFLPLLLFPFPPH